MTLTVEILNINALNLLSDMEYLDLIRLNTPAKTATVSSEKLSSQFAGVLKLTDTQYEMYQNTLQENRSEWERNIY
jgi:hypothetical protein